MIYKENVKKINRQHNNRLLIDYINKSGEKTKDKKAYTYFPKIALKCL